MFAEPSYLGAYGLDDLRVQNDRLNAKVVEQVNDTQELVMLNNFAHESNEYQYKKCLQDRMSDIASWRWVLEDLTRRLTEASGTLQYEHNALRVVITRLQSELDGPSCGGTRPGALSPLSDSVEEAILQEYNFLRDQKKKFENLVLILEKRMSFIEKTKNKIAADSLHKDQALSVEESCAKITSGMTSRGDGGRRKQKRRASPITNWENRCTALKKHGLRALSNAIVTRQQVRGARVHLSITAQAYAARVDSALRRRLNVNKIKLQDIYWQKKETMRDYEVLIEELTTTEQSIMETMEKERIVEARLADRSLRPPGEHTKDDVDRKLRDELARLRNFRKQLRDNHDRITTLQNHLSDSVTRVDCCAADILRILHLDNERITSRLGEGPVDIPEPPSLHCKVPDANQNVDLSPKSPLDVSLHSIQEEDEGDDYPFDD